jgi:hypothetical protein
MITTLLDLIVHVFWLLILFLLLVLVLAPTIWIYLATDTIVGVLSAFALLPFATVVGLFLSVLVTNISGVLYDQHVEVEGESQPSLPIGTIRTLPSRWLAVRTPTWQQNLPDHLCVVCSNTLRQSRLLRGSRSVFVPAHERYVQDADLLQETISSSNRNSCRLCSLLHSTLQPRQSRFVSHDSILATQSSDDHHYGTFYPSSSSHTEPSQSFLHIFEAIGNAGVSHIQLTMSGYSSPAFTVYRGKTPSSQLEKPS